MEPSYLSDSSERRLHSVFKDSSSFVVEEMSTEILEVSDFLRIRSSCFAFMSSTRKFLFSSYSLNNLFSRESSSIFLEVLRIKYF
jgi:hypothetical protein